MFHYILRLFLCDSLLVYLFTIPFISSFVLYIIGGHEHEINVLEHGSCLIVKCGQNLDYLGVVDLDILANFNTSLLSNIQTVDCILRKSVQILSTHDVAYDSEIEQIIFDFKTKLTTSKHTQLNNLSLENVDENEILTTVNPFSPMPLSTKTIDCRRSETAFGSYLADAYRWYFNEILKIHCDFAIQNGGFIRGDNSYKPGTVITRAIIEGNNQLINSCYNFIFYLFIHTYFLLYLTFCPRIIINISIP
jgi:2',3'-cyclic-nucleotide 2'-phosphodiesterase (5'-nucleotidase family)